MWVRTTCVARWHLSVAAQNRSAALDQARRVLYRESAVIWACVVCAWRLFYWGRFFSGPSRLRASDGALCMQHTVRFPAGAVAARVQ